MTQTPYKPDPKLDLVLERFVDVPRELVWKAWTQPEHLKKWFCPKPWYVSHCEMDLRPGGIFRSVMKGPNGEQFDNAGCFLEVVPNERLAWTDALRPGWRPAAEPFMTAIVTMTPEGTGTRYIAIAIHKDEADRKKHEEMGFDQGWSTAFDQMVEVIKTAM